MSQVQCFGAGTAGNVVSSVSTLEDNKVIRGDGGSRGVQTSAVNISDNGEMTNTSQPAFLAYLDVQTGNVTGNNTAFLLGDTDVATALTEVYDQGSNLNPGGASGAIFTAPVTGKYLMNFQVTTQFSDSTAILLDLITSNNTFRFQMMSPSAVEDVGENASFGGQIVADMDATDTAYIQVNATGGTLITQVRGRAGVTLRTFWSGTLLA